MLKLPEDLPDMDEKETSELVHKLLQEEINYIVATAKIREPMDTSFYDEYFPDYLVGTGVPEKKLTELSKMLVSPKEYTPDLEIEYALNRMMDDLREREEHTMETVQEFYQSKGRPIPDVEEFLEYLWECIFWDDDYELLDEGFTLNQLKGSLMDKMMGITGGLSAFPNEDEKSRMSQ